MRGVITYAAKNLLYPSPVLNTDYLCLLPYISLKIPLDRLRTALLDIFHRTCFLLPTNKDVWTPFPMGVILISRFAGGKILMPNLKENYLGSCVGLKTFFNSINCNKKLKIKNLVHWFTCPKNIHIATIMVSSNFKYISSKEAWLVYSEDLHKQAIRICIGLGSPQNIKLW